jgi:starch phosphorylase
LVKPIAKITITPNLPPELERLRDLAYNLRWSWDHDTIALFLRLDEQLWLDTDRNPVQMLGLIHPERYQEAVQDPAFMAQFERVWEQFQAYLHAKNTWFNTHYGAVEKPFIAYFSMEFGITTCLKNYSGGLGVLAGDHLKSASDLGLPLVGVGLLYQEGYFQQYLNASGYQQESYPMNDYSLLPVQALKDANGERLVITVPIAEHTLKAYAWLVNVGRVKLYLLDANHPDNPPDLRDLTDRLYGGDRRTRIRQEVLLGIGGIRLLHALGITPTVAHMNEGHSALLALERARFMMEENPDLSFQEAIDILATGSIYTIHTPVPAGLEKFGYDLIDEHLTWMWEALGLTRQQFHDLGREKFDGYDLFSLPVMALKFASGSNGVSKLHGRVSRRMWQNMFPAVPEEEVPVGHVTNGVHHLSWVSREMGAVFDRYLPPAWRDDPAAPEIWEAVDRIPDIELWRTHERRKERLVDFARKRLRRQFQARGLSQADIDSVEMMLDPDALTIGFARRFATYKRATLLFRDIERISRMLNDSKRPMQIIFAGKAHPHDAPGKEFIRQIVQTAMRADLRHSVVFLENYDMTIARYLVQGVDVWLNTPRRPQEASGTSGMKVIYNGGLNVSILDGWWAEAYAPGTGWAIGAGEEYPDSEAERQNEIEAQALYNILENDVVPLFFSRGRDGLPRDWIAMVKHSMKTLAPVFNTHRMVQEYTRRYYMPSHQNFQRLIGSRGKHYAAWLQGLRKYWDSVRILEVHTASDNSAVGDEVQVETKVDLGQLTPFDVSVQLYSGPLNSQGDIVEGESQDMQQIEGRNGIFIYRGHLACHMSGERGLSVRILPRHENLPDPFLTGYIRWATDNPIVATINHNHQEEADEATAKVSAPVA